LEHGLRVGVRVRVRIRIRVRGRFRVRARVRVRVRVRVSVRGWVRVRSRVTLVGAALHALDEDQAGEGELERLDRAQDVHGACDGRPHVEAQADRAAELGAWLGLGLG